MLKAIKEWASALAIAIAVALLLIYTGVLLTGYMLIFLMVCVTLTVGGMFSSLFRRREPTTGKERRDEDVGA